MLPIDFIWNDNKQPVQIWSNKRRWKPFICSFIWIFQENQSLQHTTLPKYFIWDTPILILNDFGPNGIPNQNKIMKLLLQLFVI